MCSRRCKNTPWSSSNFWLAGIFSPMARTFPSSNGGGSVGDNAALLRRRSTTITPITYRRTWATTYAQMHQYRWLWKTISHSHQIHILIVSRRYLALAAAMTGVWTYLRAFGACGQPCDCQCDPRLVPDQMNRWCHATLWGIVPRQSPFAVLKCSLLLPPVAFRMTAQIHHTNSRCMAPAITANRRVKTELVSCAQGCTQLNMQSRKFTMRFASKLTVGNST